MLFVMFSCDDEVLPSGGGKARIIVNCNVPISGENFYVNSIFGTLYSNGATDLASVTKGQTVQVNIQNISQVCKSIELKFELNGNIVETRNVNMGGLTVSSCPDGYYKSLNFIVP
jgi:small ligand-binding sensory domain FIST